MTGLLYLYLTDNHIDHIPVPLPDSLRSLHLQVPALLPHYCPLVGDVRTIGLPPYCTLVVVRGIFAQLTTISPLSASCFKTFWPILHQFQLLGESVVYLNCTFLQHCVRPVQNLKLALVGLALFFKAPD